MADPGEILKTISGQLETGLQLLRQQGEIASEQKAATERKAATESLGGGASAEDKKRQKHFEKEFDSILKDQGRRTGYGQQALVDTTNPFSSRVSAEANYAQALQSELSPTAQRGFDAAANLSGLTKDLRVQRGMEMSTRSYVGKLAAAGVPITGANVDAILEANRKVAERVANADELVTSRVNANVGGGGAGAGGGAVEAKLAAILLVIQAAVLKQDLQRRVEVASGVR